MGTDHKLITSGPYAFVRHPSYTGGCSALFGAGLLHLGRGSCIRECLQQYFPLNLSLGVLAFCGMFILHALIVRIKKEEMMLRERFGKRWDQWAKQVPYKLVPGLY